MDRDRVRLLFRPCGGLDVPEREDQKDHHHPQRCGPRQVPVRPGETGRCAKRVGSRRRLRPRSRRTVRIPEEPHLSHRHLRGGQRPRAGRQTVPRRRGEPAGRDAKEGGGPRSLRPGHLCRPFPRGGKTPLRLRCLRPAVPLRGAAHRRSRSSGRRPAGALRGHHHERGQADG